jgi:hypothetical protein
MKTETINPNHHKMVIVQSSKDVLDVYRDEIFETRLFVSELINENRYSSIQERTKCEKPFQSVR